MKTKKIRVAIPIAIGLVVAGGFAFNVGVGNLSAFGWQDVSLLCPLGALSVTLASKTFIPRVLISLGIGLLLMFLLGRLFCGWICPIPLVNKLPQLFKKKGEVQETEAKQNGHSCTHCRSQVFERFDSRHLVLGGALLSATVFGFPVFCLICPIGLSFATIFLAISLFAGGDVTWSLVLVPIVLLLEVTLFKKWCSKICPLGAMMSLMARFNKRTLRPTVDVGKCIESEHVACGRCKSVCKEGIDPRHPENGADFSECIKCHECVESCPAKAISMPVFGRIDKHENNGAKMS